MLHSYFTDDKHILMNLDDHIEKFANRKEMNKIKRMEKRRLLIKGDHTKYNCLISDRDLTVEYNKKDVMNGNHRQRQ